MPATAEKPVCPKCGRMSINVRKDGSIRCYKCGYNEIPENPGLPCNRCDQDHAFPPGDCPLKDDPEFEEIMKKNRSRREERLQKVKK